MENLLNLIPVPIALGMVLFVNNKIENHEKNCPIKEKLEELHKDVREIRNHLMK